MVLHAEFVVLEGVRGRFDQVAATFEAGVGPVSGVRDGAVDGAGELAGGLQVGASAFFLSWSQVLATCADSARLVAGNVGKEVVDLATADTGAAGALDLFTVAGAGPR